MLTQIFVWVGVEGFHHPTDSTSPQLPPPPYVYAKNLQETPYYGTWLGGTSCLTVETMYGVSMVVEVVVCATLFHPNTSHILTLYNPNSNP